MTAQDILKMVYEANDGGERPTEFVHHIGGGTWAPAQTLVAKVMREGLKPLNRWSDINALVPHRPQGVFLWGAEMRGRGHVDAEVGVSASDLDTSRLYAFPATLAHVANRAAMGIEQMDEAMEALKVARAVPYSEYHGQFVAEWIYAGDIPAQVLQEVR